MAQTSPTSKSGNRIRKLPSSEHVSQGESSDVLGSWCSSHPRLVKLLLVILGGHESTKHVSTNQRSRITWEGKLVDGCFIWPTTNSCKCQTTRRSMLTLQDADTKMSQNAVLFSKQMQLCLAYVLFIMPSHQELLNDWSPGPWALRNRHCATPSKHVRHVVRVWIVGPSARIFYIWELADHVSANQSGWLFFMWALLRQLYVFMYNN